MLPPSQKTVKGRALAFRLVARMACGVEQLLSSRHKKAPFQTFRVLTEGEAARGTIVNLAPCLQDPFTTQMLKDYPGLEGDDCLAALETLATLLPNDITEIEARHATLRRLLLGKSLQTHKMDFEDLSGQWVALQHRLHHCRPAPKSQTKPRPKKRGRARGAFRGGASDTQPRQRRGFGGAWRAWMRMRARGHAPKEGLAAAHAAEYRAAKRERSEAYEAAVALGGLMTEHAKRKGNVVSAVDTPNVKRRRLESLRLVLHTSASQEVDVVSRTMSLAAHALAQGASVGQTLLVARQASRLATQCANEEVARVDATLQRYASGPGAAASLRVLGARPWLSRLRPAPVPRVHGLCFELEPVSFEDVNSVVIEAPKRNEGSLCKRLGGGVAQEARVGDSRQLARGAEGRDGNTVLGG